MADKPDLNQLPPPRQCGKTLAALADGVRAISRAAERPAAGFVSTRSLHMRDELTPEMRAFAERLLANPGADTVGDE